jgi:hypothetical protein
MVMRIMHRLQLMKLMRRLMILLHLPMRRGLWRLRLRLVMVIGLVHV